MAKLKKAEQGIKATKDSTKYFRNERELFKGLWIDSSDYEWSEYPVIKLDISAVDKNTVDELKNGLKRLLIKVAAKYDISLD
jgi:hypothetical protein